MMFQQNFPLKSLILSLSLMTLATATHADTPATESHSTSKAAEIDPNAPIQALDTLTSLKNPQKLTLNLPQIIHFKTQTNTPVAFVSTHSIPMVNIEIRFNAGSARDGTIKPKAYGLASLTASMLLQGTPHKKVNDIAEAMEQLGLDLDTSAYKDTFSISLRSLSDSQHLTPGMSLLQEILSSPTFPENNLTNTKGRYLVALQKGQENPEVIAGNTFMQTLYGDHPYAHPTAGTLESIPIITREDLQKFYQTYLVAQNASIAITGDISLDQAKQLANQISNALPKGSPAPKLPDVKPLTAAKTIHIPFNSSQTTVMIGQLGLQRRADPDSLQDLTNFTLADDIVGGSDFQARLMSDVRKKRGLTYGIYSQMTPMQSQGNYVISFSSRNDKVKEAIQATYDVVNNTVKTGVTANEFNLTKENAINSFPFSVSSNAGINGMIGMMNFYGLPDSYLTDYVKRIDKATLAAVNNSYASHIDPTKLLTVTVGGGKSAHN